MTKTILIDLDGVLNEYNGCFDEKFICPIKKGAKEFLENISKNYTIKLFTTRNKLLVSKWLLKNKLDTYIYDITDIKEVAWLYIDDRCICFNGEYQNLEKQIKNFKVYYK